MRGKARQRLREFHLKMFRLRLPSVWLLFMIFAVFTVFFWCYLIWLPENIIPTVGGIENVLKDRLSTESFIEDLFLRRKRESDERCLSHKVKDFPKWLDANANQLDHIIVDDKRKLIYCYIPKVACTNWKRILLILDGRSNYTKLEDIPSDSVHRDNVFVKLSDLKPPDIDERIQSYEKFIFVRHPFERIVSAFKNKFEKNYKSSAYFKIRFGVAIQKMYRSDNGISPSGDGVKFSEFIQYVIDTNEEDPKKLNEHWAPYTRLCFPCDIRYNLIGKYETLKDDASYILQRLRAPEEVKFPQMTPSNTTNQVAQYISTLSEIQVSKLLKIYEDDFKIFGYLQK